MAARDLVEFVVFAAIAKSIRCNSEVHLGALDVARSFTVEGDSADRMDFVRELESVSDYSVDCSEHTEYIGSSRGQEWQVWLAA